jgi:hypothetical protein
MGIIMEENEYLKKAKEIFSDPNTSEETREAIKEIFSDLEISAIEKVRLALIKLVKDQNPEDIQNKYGISKDEAIIWLDYKKEEKKSSISWPTFVLNQEPLEKKFNEGDWIVPIDEKGKKEVYQIKKCDGYTYDLEGGGCISAIDIDKYRLWDICKDARCGDIITSRGKAIGSIKKPIFLFVKIDEEETGIFYAFCSWTQRHGYEERQSKFLTYTYISGSLEYEPVTPKQKGFFINLIKKNSVELLQYLN